MAEQVYYYNYIKEHKQGIMQACGPCMHTVPCSFVKILSALHVAKRGKNRFMIVLTSSYASALTGQIHIHCTYTEQMHIIILAVIDRQRHDMMHVQFCAITPTFTDAYVRDFWIHLR